MQEDLFEKYGKSIKKGDVLFEAGEQGSNMYVVKSGSIKITIKTHSGVDKTLAILGPGEFVGEMSLLTGQLRSATATAVENCELIVVKASVLEEMIVHNTEIALRLIRKLASRLIGADSLIKVLLHRDSKERIIENIKRLASTHKQDESNEVRFKADFDEMAEQVGLSREETENIMLKLSGAGFLVQDGGDWVIANVEDIDEFLNFLRLKEQYR
ncbi:MAG: Crp/Fnr family transcriptional regulator [Deltaproteobacteria bacterium]|nr:Crp/Fnr family transcriptional regulator [Deltaproteobacteria bacterium]